MDVRLSIKIRHAKNQLQLLVTFCQEMNKEENSVEEYGMFSLDICINNSSCYWNFGTSLLSDAKQTLSLRQVQKLL